jgi:hypothetical protein
VYGSKSLNYSLSTVTFETEIGTSVEITEDCIRGPLFGDELYIGQYLNTRVGFQNVGFQKARRLKIALQNDNHVLFFEQAEGAPKPTKDEFTLRSITYIIHISFCLPSSGGLA